MLQLAVDTSAFPHRLHIPVLQNNSSLIFMALHPTACLPHAGPTSDFHSPLIKTCELCSLFPKTPFEHFVILIIIVKEDKYALCALWLLSKVVVVTKIDDAPVSCL